MKKLLAFFASLAIVTSSVAVVISCGAGISNTDESLLDLAKQVNPNNNSLSLSFDTTEKNTSDNDIFKSFENLNKNVSFGELDYHVDRSNNPAPKLTVQIKPTSTVYNQGKIEFFLFFKDEDIKPMEPILPPKKSDVVLQQIAFVPFEYWATEKNIEDEFISKNPKYADDFKSKQISVEARIHDDHLEADVYVQTMPDSQKYNKFDESYTVYIKPKPADPLNDIPWTNTDFNLIEADLEQAADKQAYVTALFKELNSAVDFSELEDLDVKPVGSDKWFVTYTVKTSSKKYKQGSKTYSLPIKKPEPPVKHNLSFIYPPVPFKSKTTPQDVNDWFIDANKAKVDMDQEIKDGGIILNVNPTKLTDPSLEAMGIIHVEITEKSPHYKTLHNDVPYWVSKPGVLPNVAILNFDRMNVDDVINDKEAVRKAVWEKVHALNPEATKADYDIFGLEDGVTQLDLLKYNPEYPDSKINGLIVRAKTGSKHLAGESKIPVFKNINNIINSWGLPVIGDIELANKTKTTFEANLKNYLDDVEPGSDYVINQDPKNGSWNVDSIRDGRLDLDFMFTTRAQSLAMLQDNFADKVTVRDNYEALENDIETTIQKTYFPQVDLERLKKEFTITSVNNQKTEVSGKKMISVEAKPDSPYLIGSFTIDVNKSDINNSSLDPLPVLTSTDKISEQVIDLVQGTKDKSGINENLKGYLNQNGNRDFNVILDRDDPIHKLIVKASDKSKYLTGEFSVSLDKINLNKIKIDNTGLDAFTKEAEIRKQLGVGVQSLLQDGLNEQQIDNEINKIKLTKESGDNNEITWKANLDDNDSEYLTGSQLILLSKVSLAQLIEVNQFSVGDLTLDELRQTLIPDAYKSVLVEGTDYSIEDNTDNFTHAGTIIVKPVEGSKVVSQKTKATIEVSPKSVEDIKLFNEIVGLDNEKVIHLDKTIRDSINAIFKRNDITISESGVDADFSFKDENGVATTIDVIKHNPGFYELSSNSDSQKIKGSFPFIVGPIDLNSPGISKIIGNDNEVSVEDDLQIAVNNIISKIENIIGSDFKLELGKDYDVWENDELLDLESNSMATHKATIKIKANETNYLDDDGEQIIDSKLSNNTLINISGKSIRSLKIPDQVLRNKNNPDSQADDSKNDGFQTLVRNTIQTLFKTIKVQNSDFVVRNSNGSLASGASSSGIYTVSASTDSKILATGKDEQFTFKVLPDDISSLMDESLSFNVNSKTTILETIGDKLDKFTNSQPLKLGVDYDFYSDAEGKNPANLDHAGVVYVIAKQMPNPYITGKFSFRIGKSKISNDNIKFNQPGDDEILLSANATQSELDTFKTVAINKVKEATKLTQITDKDFDPINWDLAFEDGQVQFKAASTSNYIEGEFNVEIKPVSLSLVKPSFMAEFFPGLKSGAWLQEESINSITNNLSKTMAYKAFIVTIKEFIVDQLFKTPSRYSYLTNTPDKAKAFEQKLDNYLSIQGLDGWTLSGFGKNAIVIGAVPNNCFVKDSFTLGIDDRRENKLPSSTIKVNDANTSMTTYLTSSNNYFLTSEFSAWAPNKDFYNHLFNSNVALKPLGDISQWILHKTLNNPIKPDNILGTSDSFLVTDRGIYYTNKLLHGTDTWNLTANDILSISNEFVLTTKGGWYIAGYDKVKSADDYLTLSATGIEGLEEANLTRADFLGISENMIVTTKGIWLKGINHHSTTGFDQISWMKMKDGTDEIINPENLTSANILAVNNRFIVTRKGVWVLTKNDQLTIGKTGSGNLTNKYRQTGLTTDSIVKLNEDTLILKGLGIIDATDENQGIIGKPDTNVLAQSDNYLITNEGIYWKGQKLSVTDKSDYVPKKEDIILITNDWLVLANTATFYHQTHIGSRTSRNKTKLGTDLDTYFNNNDHTVIGSNSSWLIGNNVVQYKDRLDTIDTNGVKTPVDNNSGYINGATLTLDGMGEHYLNLRSKHKYYVRDGKITDHTGSGSIYRDSYWIVPLERGNNDSPPVFTNHYYLSHSRLDGKRYAYYFSTETGDLNYIGLYGDSNANTFVAGNWIYFKAVDGTLNQPGTYTLFYKGIKMVGSHDPKNFVLSDILSITDDRIITKNGIYFNPTGNGGHTWLYEYDKIQYNKK